MSRTLTMAVLVAMLAGRPLVAQQSPGEDEIARTLYAPELVMRHAQTIGLTGEQRSAITAAIQDLQTTAVELQWQMAERSRALIELLSQSTVDESAALAQIDLLLETEQEIKRRHLAMLIRIKNLLNPEQQERLRSQRGGDK